MRESLATYCARHHRRDLLDQWDGSRNGTLTPDTVSYGSRKNSGGAVNRAMCGRRRCTPGPGERGGRPYCAGKRPWPGFNDLASRFPDLAKEWHPTKNGGPHPGPSPLGQEPPGVVAVCPRPVWDARVKSRAAGAGARCASRQISRGTTIWPPNTPTWPPSGTTQNGTCGPRTWSGSRRKVWWQCPGARGGRRPLPPGPAEAQAARCAPASRWCLGENDLATLFPQLAQQWDREKNGALTPQQVSSYSNRAAWWRCPLGHSWRAAISARAWGSDCPYCAGRKVLPGFNDLATRDPAVAAEWDPDLNGAPDAPDGDRRRPQKAWWRCPENHVWKAVVYSRTGPKHCGRPVCAGKAKQTRGRPYATLPSPRAHHECGKGIQDIGGTIMRKRVLSVLMTLLHGADVGDAGDGNRRRPGRSDWG